MKAKTQRLSQLAQTPTLRECRFAELLLKVNDLNQAGFEKWLFCPGMPFNDLKKWWGDHGQRDFPHEGVDLCLYRGIDSHIRRLDATGRVPAMGDGAVKALFTDYLGKAIIIEHERLPAQNWRLLSIYAHTNPSPGIGIGANIKEGDIIATLADTRLSKANIIPHLHFTLALASPFLSYEDFVWNVIRDPDRITLLDPLSHIHLPYRMCAPDNPYCLGL